MPTAYWSNYAGYLTTTLAEYEEIVCQVTEDINKIIATFGLILFHTDFIILSKSESPDHQASWADIEVRRVALDTIEQAAAIRNSMQHVHQEAQGGLNKAKEVMQAFKGGRSLSPGEIEHFVHEVSEVGEVLQQVSAKADDLIPAAMDVLQVAKVLQKKMEILAASPGPGGLDHASHRANTGGHAFPPAACPGRKFGRDRDMNLLISLARQKIREN